MKGSTFAKMYSLAKDSSTHKHEDYLSEIISRVFTKTEFIHSYLKKFSGKKIDEIDEINVSTQRTYRKLLTHDTDSRPDIVLTFKSDNDRYLVFFENKIEASEGINQLDRYIDHLKKHAALGYKVLLFYITKKFDPKVYSSLELHGVTFIQLQWFQVYQWLDHFNDDLYCMQVLDYMEALNLNKTRKFSAVDIYALQSISRLQSMMDDCLSGIVSATFFKQFDKPKKLSTRSTQLREENRYTMFNDQCDWKFVGCGFWFNEEEYPDISVYLEVGNESSSKPEIIEAMEKFVVTNREWEFQAPEDDQSYFFLYADKSLLEFLAESDHIEAIQAFMIEKLNELHKFKIENPHLNWVVK